MDYMERAIALAHQAVGVTSPNPSVGAIIVKDDLIIGKGVTRPKGQNHAEITALVNAGHKSRGAILYTSMEPCNFHGATPPCTQAIIQAGIREVHIATLDPNPKVNGNGVDELKASGIRVILGEYEDKVKELYEGFSKHINTGLPFVIAKYAMSLDGKLATHTGHSKWISNQQSRQSAQKLRSTVDGIMIGINTIIKDNPRLTSRGTNDTPRKYQPLRIIVDSHGNTPISSQLLNEPGKTIIVTANPIRKKILDLENSGAEVLKLPSNNGQVDLELLLKELGRRNVVSLLVEGGGTLLGSLFDLRLVDKVVAFISPIIVGGSNAISPVQGSGAICINDAIGIENVRLDMLGNDLKFSGYPIMKG